MGRRAPRSLIVLAMASGCSFVASTRPPGMTTSCMPDRSPPHVDTAVVVGAAVIDGALVAASFSGSGCNGTFGCLDQIAIGAVVTALALPYLASAIYGYAKDECPSADQR
jgi:hypothetical protein